MDGIWATALELDTSVPTILLFDADGEEVFRHAGMYKKSAFPPVEAQLAELLRLPVGSAVAARD